MKKAYNKTVRAIELILWFNGTLASGAFITGAFLGENIFYSGITLFFNLMFLILLKLYCIESLQIRKLNDDYKAEINKYYDNKKLEYFTACNEFFNVKKDN